MTKAELRVRAANRDGLETVVIRPRFVWGRGDTTLLPAIIAMVRSGRFATWIASQECTIDISRAERDLGYRPVKSREDGLAELAGAAPAA